MLQAEFALTQVFDRPVQGRVFFEEVMRENLDLGRPDHVQLILRQTRHPTHTLAVSNPRDNRRGHPVAARRLQALAHQAVPQGGARPAHRDGGQRHLRLRCRQTAEELRGSQADRLRSQPTPVARPTCQPQEKPTVGF